MKRGTPPIRPSWLIASTVAVIIAGYIAWGLWPPQLSRATRIRVFKVRSKDGTPASRIHYDVQLHDGRSKAFEDITPFGSLNEVMVVLGPAQHAVARYRNDPLSTSRVDHRPDQELLPIDDEDFARVQSVVANAIDIGKLKWKDDETSDKDNAMTEGIVLTSEPVVTIAYTVERAR